MLSTEEIPQADRLLRVLLLVRSPDASFPAGGGDGRDLSYYRHAARVLGWLDAHHQHTASGLAVLHAEEDPPWSLAAQAFVHSAIGQAWLAFCGVERLSQLDENSAEDFLALAYQTFQQRFGLTVSQEE